MNFLIPERVDTPELLDEHDAPRADVERSLRDLRRINRYLGGIRIYRKMTRPFAPFRSILDLGAGTADLLLNVDASLRVALDIKIDHLLYLRDGTNVRAVVGDAMRLPFRDAAVDVITSAHFFHHFSAEENARIAAESLRVARKGVAFNDTRRHYIPLLFISLLAAMRLVGRITRYDGPASVRRAYTADEAASIGRRVAARVSVVRAFPYRFGLLLWK
ncbi:MAG TPA: methyltransferase domain-containing protein [Thermoanaerobaculia bacterium]